MNLEVFQSILDKKEQIAVIGLGYVGLPIALCFAKKANVIGFDINTDRINLMKEGIDPSGELEKSDFKDADIQFTSDPEYLNKALFFIIAVPTPIDKHNLPDLGPLLSAVKTVGKALKKGDYVVFESTVYPGCTEEDCLPLLEEISGLKRTEFKIGYSPERINPGDKTHTLSKIIKVVSGSDPEALENIASVYEMVVEAGIHRATSIKVAEAAKIIENTQRDLNISLMNELSMIFNKMQINTYDVLDAAGTKWNFLKFTPGLVGGHCIGVDPYYLTYKSKELGFDPKVILSGRTINDSMSAYVSKTAVQLLIKANKEISKSKALVMGATFKENVSDIRNSKVADLVNELISFGINVTIVDPKAEKAAFKKEYGLELEKIESNYDLIIIAVPHEEYIKFDETFFKEISNANTIVMDLKGIYRDKIKNITYWSL